MRTYECDGLTGRRAVPQAVVLPRHDRRGAGGGARMPRPRHPVRRPRRRHRPLRRRGADRRGHRDRPGAHEPHPRRGRAEPARARAAGRRQPRRHPGGRSLMASTTPPTRPASRCARSAATSPRTPAARTASSTGSPPTTCSSSRSCWPAATSCASTGPASSTCWAGSSARRARSGSRPRSSSRCCPGPQRVETMLAAFESTDAAGEVVSAIIAAGIVPAAIEMMDALTIRAAEAAVGAGLPLDAGAVLLIELDGPAVEVEVTSARVRECCAAGRRHRGAGGRDRGAAGRVLARAQGRVRRHGPDQPRLLRAGRRRPAHPRCPRRCAGSASSPARTASRSETCSTRATATCTRWCSTTARSRAQAERAEELASAILQACVDAGGSLTGEHGIGLDKACHMPLMYSRRRHGDDAAPAHRLRSGRPVQSGQGVPDPAPVRRGARPLPPASRRARGGRAMVIEHEPGDLTCTVAADVPLAELQRVVARGGQMLALDPPGGDAAHRRRGVRDGRRSGRAPTATAPPRDLVLGDDRAAGRRHGRARRRPGRQDGGRLRPAQALHRRAGPAGRDPRADAAPAPAARGDLHRRHRARPTRSCSSRSRRPASSTPGRPSACWCGSRARSRARWPSRLRSWWGASCTMTTRGSGPSTASWRRDSRSLAACPPTCPNTIAQLRAAGATTIVGRLRPRPAPRRREY